MLEPLECGKGLSIVGDEVGQVWQVGMIGEGLIFVSRCSFGRFRPKVANGRVECCA